MITGAGYRLTTPRRTAHAATSVRFAQPVFNKIERTWFAAVLALMCSARPMSALLKPSARQSRISRSRGVSVVCTPFVSTSSAPSGAVLGVRLVVECLLDLAGEQRRSLFERGHPDRARGLDDVVEERERPTRAVAATLPHEEPRVAEAAVREPGRGAGRGLELDRLHVVTFRVAAAPGGLGERAEVAVDGAVRRDQVPDDHERVAVRLELGVHGGRRVPVADDRHRVGQVRE